MVKLFFILTLFLLFCFTLFTISFHSPFLPVIRNDAGNFPGSPVVKISLSNAAGVGLIPG